jgi:hypothetical protein
MTATDVAKQQEYLLTVDDRCDSCGGQAYVAVTGVSGELMFCAHHYNKIISNPKAKEALTDFAYDITDERERLTIGS